MTPYAARAGLVVGPLLFVAACNAGSGAAPSDGGSSCTFSCYGGADERDDTQKVLSILDDRCGSVDGCHGIGAGGLGINQGMELAVLIDVPSTEDPSLVRVRPGDPAQSYLWRKLACEGGIQKSCMPADGPLALEYVQAFHDWIEAGAPMQ